MPRFLSLDTLVVKMLGTALAVGSGLAVGPEGPLVHVGAIIGSGLTRGAKSVRCGGARRYALRWPWLRRFANDVDRRDFISVGAAAGFAAAFGAPVGGILFSLEAVSYTHLTLPTTPYV